MPLGHPIVGAQNSFEMTSRHGDTCFHPLVGYPHTTSVALQLGVSMPKLALTLALARAVLACVLAAGSAQAQTNVHSWVSTTGGGGACTRAAPCSSANTALAATFAGGVVSFLDPGAGDATSAIINKSITLRAEGVDAGPTDLQSSTGGPWITINAGPTDVVTIEGLHLNGGGIIFTSGAQLHVFRCTIMNLAASGEAGIRFQTERCQQAGG